MRRHPNPTLCPVRGIETYVATSRELGVNISTGFLFRATNPQGHVLDKPFLSTTAESRLKKYLQDANIHNGETLHSFRSGCALTLTFAGSPLADVMSHIGWTNPKTAAYYLKLADVIRAGAPAERLSSSLSSHLEASRVYSQYNTLQDFVSAFVSAFPVPAASTFKRSLHS